MARSDHELRERMAALRRKVAAVRERIRTTVTERIDERRLTLASSDDLGPLRERLLFLNAEAERSEAALGELEWAAGEAGDDLPRIPVSKGELVDRISILRIKVEKIKDETKLVHAHRELDGLLLQLDFGVTPGTAHFDELEGINRGLWETEDILREKERRQEFDADFIHHARRVYKLNDQRGRLKNRISELTGSSLLEVKHYAEYPE